MGQSFLTPYLVLQFGDSEERVGARLALLCLDREVIRKRGGAIRHLERSELAFNIEGDNLSRLYPSGHVFGPLLSSFRTKFTCYSSHSARNNKNII